MGIFKKKTSTNDELNALWKDAYRANPRVYQKDDTVIVAFALTETADSLFPLVPEKQWAIEGKTIDKWIISMVSLTKDEVLGQIEYHQAMERLKPYFLAEKDGWVLIRGLTLDEMESMFEGIPRSAL